MKKLSDKQKLKKFIAGRSTQKETEVKGSSSNRKKSDIKQIKSTHNAIGKYKIKWKFFLIFNCF